MVDINFLEILSYLHDYDSNTSHLNARNSYIEDSLKVLTPNADDLLELICCRSPTLEETVVDYATVTLCKRIINPDRLNDCLNFLNRNIWYSVEDTKSITAAEVIHLAFDQMMSIINFHPFNDGNKRTGVVSFFFFVQRVFQRVLNLPPTQLTLMAYSLCKLLEKQDALGARDLWKDIIILNLVK